MIEKREFIGCWLFDYDASLILIAMITFTTIIDLKFNENDISYAYVVN